MGPSVLLQHKIKLLQLQKYLMLKGGYLERMHLPWSIISLIKYTTYFDGSSCFFLVLGDSLAEEELLVNFDFTKCTRDLP